VGGITDTIPFKSFGKKKNARTDFFPLPKTFISKANPQIVSENAVA